jgi:chorismate mutase
MRKDFIIVDSSMLPSVFSKVLIVKELLKTGKVNNLPDALDIVNISKSTYYKYKDSVFQYRK